MKKITSIITLAVLMASCSNGSSGVQNTSDSTTTSVNSDTTMTNPENMAGGNATDTNGHILNNGKVRMGTDKVENGDVKLSDSAK